MANSSPATFQVLDYTLQEKIGVGSFATVFRAERTSTGGSGEKVVAIKVIAKNKLTKKLLLALEGEISILEKLAHENIVRLYQNHKTKSNIYLFMEYCAGGDLHNFIRKQGPLPGKVAQHFMIELAKGLKFLYSHALVHRDLKPHNLLLVEFSPTSTLKIADFGFARHLNEAALADTLCGSPLYMAPEILRHKKYDAKADLWSVGTVLYEMLVGRPPFSGANPQELLTNIERTDLKIPKHVASDQEVIQMLKLLLRRNPMERISFKEFFNNKYLSPNNNTSAPDFDGGLRTPSPSKQYFNLKTFPLDEDADVAEMNFLKQIAEGDEGNNDEEEEYGGGGFQSARNDDSSSQEVYVNEEMHALRKQANGSKNSNVSGGPNNNSAEWEMLNGSREKPTRPQTTSPPPAMVQLPTKESTPVAVATTTMVKKQSSSENAPGRALTFALQVGERSIKLAHQTERIAELFDKNGTSEKKYAHCALILCECIRLISMACAAAEDARVSAIAIGNESLEKHATQILNELHHWFSVFKRKVMSILELVGKATPLHHDSSKAKYIIFKVALLLGKEACGREYLLSEVPGDGEEEALILADYSLALMLLQILTVDHTYKKSIFSYLSLFENKLNSLVKRMGGKNLS